MDGVIVIDKEKDMTSHDVVAKLRHTFGTKKIGHTGTLDPIATGVLVVCVGQGTKLVQYLTCDDKIYDVEMKFGEKTDTGEYFRRKDMSGTAELPVCPYRQGKNAAF